MALPPSPTRGLLSGWMETVYWVWAEIKRGCKMVGFSSLSDTCDGRKGTVLQMDGRWEVGIGRETFSDSIK